MQAIALCFHVGSFGVIDTALRVKQSLEASETSTSLGLLLNIVDNTPEGGMVGDVSLVGKNTWNT